MPAIIPESKPINNTFLRRFLVLASIQLLKRFRRRDGRILFLTDALCVKYGPLRSLSEASTIQFIAQHTSIPVPKIYCSFTHNGWTYIVMERVCGDILGHGWLSRTVESKTKIHIQLKGMVAEMRKLNPTTLGVASVDGGTLFDGRIYGPMKFGPFESIQDFHRYLRGGLEVDERNPKDANQLITWQDGQWSAPVFTHGDLSSLNILAKGDEIVAIVDWETAGWYPAYWEYTTAMQTNPQNLFWKDEIDSFLEPATEELAMEKIRQKYFGDI